MSCASLLLRCVAQSTLQISAGKAAVRERAGWQTACCRQTQHNTAAVSLSDGWAWYRGNPVKAFWRITMSNSKPCNMLYNNKGILQTFFNLGARWTGDWHDSRSLPRSHPLLLLSLHPDTISLLFSPLHLSITVHVTPFDVPAPIHHPFTLFHFISLLHSLFSSLALICLLTPPSCLSLQGLHSLPHI